MPRSISSALLSWWGIVVGAIGLFSNLQGLLELAGRARTLVDAWGRWVNLGWDYVLHPLNVDLTPGSRFQSTMAMTLIAIAIGARLSTSKYDDPTKWSPGVHNLIRANVVVAVALFAAHSWLFGFYLPQLSPGMLPSWFWSVQHFAFYGIYAAAIFIGLVHWPLFAAATGTLAALVFSEAFQRAALTVQPGASENETTSLLVGSGVSIFAGLLTLCVAPPKAFTHRVWFVMIGLAVLIGLNELSKFDFGIAPPTKR